jgi:AbiU2
MKKFQLATADFGKTADALTNESLNGYTHLGIAEGLAKIDPFVGGYAPVFFMYSIFANLAAAEMHANKMFDTHSNAVTVQDFLEMARMRSTKFTFATEQEVLTEIENSENEISLLTPTIKILRSHRNDFLAHLSPKLAFTPEQVFVQLAMADIRKVLYTGGDIVNQLPRKWSNSSNQLIESNVEDYKIVVGLASKQLCTDIRADEAKFVQRGLKPSPRPRDCPE